jgi:aspartokinase/homoserine dehydrogenase 1
MIVCKFGGSSVENSASIVKVKNIILKKLKKYNKLVLVFSAIGKTTDRLLEIGNYASDRNILDNNYDSLINKLIEKHSNIIDNLIIKDKDIVLDKIGKYYSKLKEICMGIFYLKDFSDKNCDLLLSYGEKMSNLIIYYYLKQEINDKKIDLMNSQDYLITDYTYGNANVIDSKTSNKFKEINVTNYEIMIFPGFISKNDSEYITTLGRGGGDYTAALIGANMNAELVEIWTDVDGIMTSDPRIVKNAIPIKNISYNEMMELSHYGANIIYTPTILPLYNKKIPIIVKNTFKPDYDGTRIDFETHNVNKIATAISNIRDVTLIKIYGNYLIGNVGFSSNLFSLFSNNNINIIMISQSSSEHSIYVVINKKDTEVAKYQLSYSYQKQIKLNDVILEFWDNKSVLAIETNNYDNITEILARIYPIFRKYHIKIYAQTNSDHNICLILDRKYLNPIQNLVHDEVFFQKKSVNVLLVGVGLVGTELVEQIKKLDNINIIGIANSKKLIYNELGLDLENVNNQLDNGDDYDLKDLIEKIIECKLFNKVFIDCTSSELIYNNYQKLLNNFVSVVTPNKKANTTNYQFFEKLVSYPNYKYETTVGAGLPVVETIKNLIKNGDKIIKVEAILSGTMSYIFNTFSNCDESFLDVVKKAQELGFTEPNPKDDLNGMDVVRKILIISRLTGLKLEISDIKNENFLSKECLESKSTEDFYVALEKYQENINKIKTNAQIQDKVVKHIATLENNKATVGLVEIDKSHPFYSLQGSDNMLIITSNYYNKNKLIIRGPGAGASVTAAGIISDIFLSI